MNELLLDLRASVSAYIEGLQRVLASLDLEQVQEFIRSIEAAYERDRQVFIIGNGGSAATASHMACDLAKTFLTAGRHGPLKRFRVMALTDNVPLLTALANDVSYDAVFAEQLRNLADEGDLLIVISGSGNSPNVLEAVRAAKECGLRCVGLLGSDGGAVRELLDHCVIVDSDDYGQIEDVHMVLNHICAASLKRP